MKMDNLLIVLGNGFDLACKCPTSYIDFYNHLSTLENYHKLFDYCDELYKNQNDEDICLHISNYLFEHREISFWTLYFYIILVKNINAGRNWLDVETELKNFLITKTKYNEVAKLFDFEINGGKNPEITNPLNKLFEKVIFRRCEEDLFDSNPKNWSIAFDDNYLSNFLFEELKIFEDEFSLYIKQYDDDKSISKRLKLLDKIEGNFTRYESEYYISTLNYTSLGNDLDVFHIHGDASKPIFGIENLESSPAYIEKFLKINRVVEDPDIPSFSQFFGNKKYDLVFYGVSFSDTDIDLLKYLSDYLKDDYRIYVLYTPYEKDGGVYNPRNDLKNNLFNCLKNIPKYRISSKTDYSDKIVRGYTFSFDKIEIPNDFFDD